MKLRVKLFAGLRELLESDSIEVEVPTGVTIDKLRIHLEEMFPSALNQIQQSVFAVDREYAPPNVVLTENREIALIPPVGGGSPGMDSCRITEDLLSVDEAFKALESVHNGGTVLFCGTVREWTKGRRTEKLSYEAYKDMALGHMRKIEEEVLAEFPGVTTIQWHRIGELHPTDVAVICAAASAHRDAAFQAARRLIERLKSEVPIWKKEHFSDGSTLWQGNQEQPSI